MQGGENMKENKVQWQVIAGIILALIIAIFAVINVDPVEVNFFICSSRVAININYFRLCSLRLFDYLFLKYREISWNEEKSKTINHRKSRIGTSTSSCQSNEKLIHLK